MTIERDPERNEITLLQRLVDFSARRVLEVGCGEGRLTWRYADRAGRVTAIDPDGSALRKARHNRPPQLRGRVRFSRAAIGEYVAKHPAPAHDIALFSWSL